MIKNIPTIPSLLPSGAVRNCTVCAQLYVQQSECSQFGEAGRGADD